MRSSSASYTEGGPVRELMGDEIDLVAGGILGGGSVSPPPGISSRPPTGSLGSDVVRFFTDAANGAPKSRRAGRCATEPSRPRSIRSLRDLGSRKPARIMPGRESAAELISQGLFGFPQSLGYSNDPLPFGPQSASPRWQVLNPPSRDLQGGAGQKHRRQFWCFGRIAAGGLVVATAPNFIFAGRVAQLVQAPFCLA